MRTNPDISCRLVPSPSRYEIRWKRGKCGNTKIHGGFCASRAPPPNVQMFYPRTMVLQNKVNQTTKIRAKAKEADKVWDERFIQRKLKDNPPSSTLRAEPLLSLWFILHVPQEKALLAGCFQDTLRETVLIRFP